MTDNLEHAVLPATFSTLFITFRTQLNTNTRLDRLSALLEGLAPRVVVSQLASGLSNIRIEASSEKFLHLHLLSEGRMRLNISPEDRQEIEAPCLIVCRSDITHSLQFISTEDSQHLVCARAFLEGPIASLLLNEFETPVVASLSNAESSLRHILNLISCELTTPRCGQPALLNRAGDILFIGLLRHLIAHPRTKTGLLNALSDPRIARALVAIHAKPQFKWSLESLAEEANMSRTSFANTFRETMNQPPGKYLAKVRLSIAQRAVQSGKSLKIAANRSGYTSPSALSRALSREAK